MDSSLPSSKSAPSNLIVGRRHRVSISSSWSHQSHLSNVGHLHRVRTTFEQISLSSTIDPQDDVHLEDGLASLRPRDRFSKLKQIVTDPATFLYDDLRRIRSGHSIWRLRTLVTVYCCLCTVLFAIQIYTLSRQALRLPDNFSDRPPSRKPDTPPDSTLETSINMTSTQRMSVAFRNISPRARLDAFVVQAQAPPSSDSDLTACLWIEDASIDKFLSESAATRTWSGSISLVVVTTQTPGSADYDRIRDRLRQMPHSKRNAHVHVLYVPSIAGASTNTYLNMARFFARTSRVVLFPDDMTKPGRWQDDLNSVISNTLVPTRKLAPIVISRDHPVWCPERFYVYGSRALDWDDCVWKMWLESAGEASSIGIPVVESLSKNDSSVSVSPFATKIRLRWSHRYRSEACVFALKRSQALGSLTRAEKKHMQWRKKFCRETVGPGVALDSP